MNAARSLGLSISALLLLGSSVASRAQEKSAAPDVPQDTAASGALDQTHQLDIPPGNLSSALIELSKQTGLQIMMPSGPFKALESTGLKGNLAIKEAMEKLLEGTGYGYHATGSRTITVDAPSAALDSVSGVVATSDAEPAATIPVTSLTSEPEVRESTSTTPAEPGTQRLDDVIVTATKREKSVREIPVTIHAIQGEDLEKIGARELKDFISQVPGVTLQDGLYGEAGSRKITIRGVGPTEVAGAAGNQTVGVLIGDIPMSDPYSNLMTPDVDPFDLKDVEILKGPQGTIFGASALNGVIRYVPNKPELGQFSGRGFVDHNELKFGGEATSYGAALNVPMGEEVAGRVVGVIQNRPGLYDNLQRDTPDSDTAAKWSGRAMLSWKPDEVFSLDGMFLKQRLRVDDFLQSTLGDGTYRDDSKPGPSMIETGFDLATVDARYTLGDLGTLVAQASRQNKDVLVDVDTGLLGSFGVQALRAFATYQIHGDTYELRLVSEDGDRWNWIAGLFYMKYVAQINADVVVARTGFLGGLSSTLPGAVVTSRGVSIGQNDIHPLATESSAYGELTRKIADIGEITLGVRLYDTQLSGGKHTTGIIGLADPEGSLTNFDQREKGLSPKFSVLFKPWQNILLYTTTARGFQFGGINAPGTVSLPFYNPVTGVPIPNEFKPSNLWSSELGVRTDWFDKTFRADVTVFNLDWNNAQFGQHSGGQVTDNKFIGNVGKVRSRGAEGTLNWLTPLPGLSFNVAASYIVAKTAADFDDGRGKIIAAGADMPATPRVQLANTATYSTSLGSWATSASFSHSYWGPGYSNLEHTYTIYDFNTLNLYCSLARPDWTGRPSLTVGATNLLDERALLDRIPPTATAIAIGRSYVDTYGRPFTLSVRLTAEFD